ncbi:glycosyltransferase [Parasphingorhabdus pacifica]
MRILFSSLAAHGHTYPLLPLATAARAEGHDVRFASGEAMHEPLREAGFDPILAGLSIFEAGTEAGRRIHGPGFDLAALAPEQMRAVGAAAFGEVLPRRFVNDLQPVLERFDPALVVFDSANSGAEIAARSAGVPALFHGLGPAVTAGFEDHRERLAEFAAGLDPPVPEDADGTPYLDIYPPSMQEHGFRSGEHRVEMRPVPFAESTQPPEGMARSDHDRPMVYLTFGTGFGTARTLRRVIDALARLKVNVLVATGPSVDVAALGTLPDNVRAEAWVPQAAVLPHADVLVHHGGSGTTLGALSVGVPQLLLPAGADQFANADAVRSSGAGERLLADEVGPEALVAMVSGLLADRSYHEAAGRVAAEIAAMPSPELIARGLPELADRYRPV